jgi:phosphoribulokinase
MKARRPIIIGIVGDSAAGKTTISRGLEQILGEDRVTHVCTDDYHMYDRRERSKLGITALHPDCNYLDILELHLERLHYGQPILKPVYDHATGTLVRPEYVLAKEFVIVEGLLGFLTEPMRAFYDVKVYLDPPEDLRKVWKIKRDTSKRGYSAEDVLREWEKRRDDSSAFIRPQRAHADMAVSFYPPEGAKLEEAGPNLNVRLVLRPTIPHPDLTYLLENDGEDSPGVKLVLGRDAGRPVDFLEIEGTVSEEHAHKLEDAIWAHLPDLRPVGHDVVGSYQDRMEVRHSHPLALTQLLLIYHLLRKYSDGNIPYAPPLAALTRMRGVPAHDPTGNGV